jgi:hypothetical protein
MLTMDAGWPGREGRVANDRQRCLCTAAGPIGRGCGAADQSIDWQLGGTPEEQAARISPSRYTSRWQMRTNEGRKISLK